MNRTSIAIALSVFALGCAPEETIWLLQVPYNTEPNCQQDITHNFSGAYIPDTPPGDWTETEQSAQSDALYFVQISRSDADSAVMVLAGEVWPGVSAGDGEWEFAWTGIEDTRASREHDEGYRFTQQTYLETAETITLAIDGDVASGEWSVVTVVDETYTETDEWDEEVGMFSGDIPSASYLAYDDGDVDGIPQSNIYDDSDCSDSTCQLRVVDTCVDNRDFEATKTGFDYEDAYDQLEAATQPHGS